MFWNVKICIWKDFKLILIFSFKSDHSESIVDMHIENDKKKMIILSEKNGFAEQQQQKIFVCMKKRTYIFAHKSV